jgi:hypothetical protein
VINVYHKNVSSRVVNAVISRPSYIILREPSLIYASVQFCALLQIPIRLYGDSKNLKNFTTSPHLQRAITCSRTVTRKYGKCFTGCKYFFPKATTLNVTDLPKPCPDMTIQWYFGIRPLWNKSNLVYVLFGRRKILPGIRPLFGMRLAC